MNEKKRITLSCITWNALFVGTASLLIGLRTVSSTGALQNWNWTEVVFFCSFHFSFYFLISLLFGLAALFLSDVTRKNKVGFYGLLSINVVILTFLIANNYVFVLYRTHINLAMLQMTFLGGGKIVSFSSEMLAQIGGFLIGILFASFLFIKISQKIQNLKKTVYVILCGTVLVFLINNFINAYCRALYKTNITSISEKIPYLKPLTMTRFLERHGIISKEDIQKQSVNVSPSGRDLKHPLQPLICQPKDKKNIVFLFVDTLRADMFTQEIMPNLTAFGNENTVFKNNYSNGNNTRHGIFSLFTGIPGSYWTKALSSSTPSVLITALQKEDYGIGIFAGAPLNLPEFHTTIFSSVDNLRVWPRGEGANQSDQFAIENFENWVKKLPKGKPFFSFIFLDSVHAYDFPKTPEHEYFVPYWKNINHMKLNNDFDPTEYLNTYKNSVRFADTMIQQVIDFLKKENLLDNTILVISSDHGDEFNDNKLNYWSHGGNFTDPQIKVPLVIHWPGKPKGTFDYLTTLMDLVPTILPEVLGCTNPTSDYSVGQNIWEPDRKRNWFYSSGYDRNAFVEPDRIVLINKAGLMEFLDKTYRPSKNKSIPPYMAEVMEETSRFAK
ncbi:sulfatase-like hydrolase/transferase [Turicimonas muris]|uniref:sulfatase-like hydrolase/transferase n=11 Tax=Turicimonas muris TaxID=1796652 RepID=UPI0023F1B39E|nr:sulfatase-like hydrolase/transferase [Turicimonas muris]